MAEKNNYYKHSSVLITYLHYCAVYNYSSSSQRELDGRGGNCIISSLIILLLSAFRNM